MNQIKFTYHYLKLNWSEVIPPENLKGSLCPKIVLELSNNEQLSLSSILILKVLGLNMLEPTIYP